MATVVALVMVVTSVWALVDCLRTQGDAVRGLPVAAWLAVIVFLPLVGPLAWVLARRVPAAQPVAAAAQGAPLGPDDDPDFLRSLDRRRGEA